MDIEQFSIWLEGYREAWENRSPEAAVELFSEEASYQETPFSPPLVGHKAIHTYWSEVPHSQTEISFRWKILGLLGNTGTAHWQARFQRVPSGTWVSLDGILTAEFDVHGHCRIFREWWHRQESEPS